MQKQGSNYILKTTSTTPKKTGKKSVLEIKDIIRCLKKIKVPKGAVIDTIFLRDEDWNNYWSNDNDKKFISVTLSREGGWSKTLTIELENEKDN